MSIRLMPISRSLLLMVAVLLLFSNSARAEKLLRWKFQPGQKLQLITTEISDLETNLGGQINKIKSESTYEIDWKVGRIESNGDAHITQSISRIQLEMSSSQQDTLVYDSASKKKSGFPAKLLNEAFRPLLKSKMNMILASTGEVVKVDFLDQESEALLNQIKDLVSVESLSGLFEHASVSFPENAVNEGDQWNRSHEFSSKLGRFKVVSTFTYRGTAEVDGQELEKIEMTAISTLLKDKNAKGPKTTLKSQKLSGVLYFDAEAGRLVSSTINQEMTNQLRYRDNLVEAKLKTTTMIQIKSAGK